MSHVPHIEFRVTYKNGGKGLWHPYSWNTVLFYIRYLKRQKDDRYRPAYVEVRER